MEKNEKVYIGASRRSSTKHFARDSSNSRRRAARALRFEPIQLDLGQCLVGSIDNVAEFLAIVEGESFG